MPRAERKADAPLAGALASGGRVLQRKCAQCEDQEQGKPMQAKGATGRPAYGATSPSASALEGAHQAVRSSAGAPLDHSTRAHMESRFGYDFSRVRIHSDGGAAVAARAVNALAYTVGSDVVFAAGRYAPGTVAGRRLLAHELAHVVQQAAGANGAGVAPAVQPSAATGASGDDRFEREADAIADRVVGGGGGSPVPASAAPVAVMRAPDPCVSRCENDFNDCTRRSQSAMACLAQRSACLRSCSEREEAKKDAGKAPPDAGGGAKAKDAAAEDAGKTGKCPPPAGPGNQPAAASQTLIDRAMGKFAAKDGDPGEGCIPHPYVASARETVCTIGYGHQIPTCPVVMKTTNAPPTAEEKKTAKVSDLGCACAGSVTFDCKGPQGEKQLKSDAAGAATHVHAVLPVDLDQAQFDAFVDITLHMGHVPQELVGAVKTHWCTDAGKDFVRELYLRTALTAQGSKKVEPGFVKRRQLRVWPPSSTP